MIFINCLADLCLFHFSDIIEHKIDKLNCEAFPGIDEETLFDNLLKLQIVVCSQAKASDGFLDIQVTLILIKDEDPKIILDFQTDEQECMM